MTLAGARSLQAGSAGPRASNPSGLPLPPVLGALSASRATTRSAAQTTLTLCAASWGTKQREVVPLTAVRVMTPGIGALMARRGDRFFPADLRGGVAQRGITVANDRNT
jgi:hypothetical protein